MNVLEIKGNIFDLLWGVNDETILLKIRHLVSETIDEASKTGEDWWNELPPNQQAILESRIKDAEADENLISNEEALKAIDAKFKTLANNHSRFF